MSNIWANLLTILVGGLLVNNFVMNRFLGCCPFLGVSKQYDTAKGMSMAVIFVMTLASFITWFVQHLILVPLHLEYMQTIAFILVIAVLVGIVEMALKGDLDKVDLYVGELSKTEDGYMPSKVTAANFGKVTDFSTKEDIAAGLVNMVFQTVGMMSVFAAQTVGLKDIVLIGNLSKFPNIRELCKQVEDLHDVHFHVPEFSEYATAYGAALSNR